MLLRTPARASVNMQNMVVSSSSSFTSARRCASVKATAEGSERCEQMAALMKDDSIGSAFSFSAASSLHARETGVSVLVNACSIPSCQDHDSIAERMLSIGLQTSNACF